jgi:hypothetical protein
MTLHSACIVQMALFMGWYVQASYRLVEQVCEVNTASLQARLYGISRNRLYGTL